MFKKVLAVVFGVLKIDGFAKEDGKSVLSVDQEKELVALYGEKFTEKFKADLKAYEASDAHVEESVVIAEHKEFKANSEKEIANLKAQLIAKQGLIDAMAQDAESDVVEKTPAKTGKVIGMGAKPNMSLQHNSIAKDYLSGNTGVIVAGDTIDVSDVITEFGDLVNYYKPEMLTDLFQGFDSAKYMTVKRAINSWKASKALISSVIQQFVPKWTPLGKSTFTPLEIPLRRFKINVPILPAEVEDWIFAMYDEGLTPEQMPVTKYIINNLIKPQAMEDIESIIGVGEFTELDWGSVSEGDAGQAPINSIDGFVTILQNQYDLGTSNINFLLEGVTITESNIVDEVNNFVDSVLSVYKRKKMNLHMSEDMVVMYKRAYQTLYPNTKNQDAEKYRIDFSNFTLVGLPSMSGTNVMFATPKENFIMVRHKNEPGATKLFMEKENYTVKVFGEFRLGVGFAMAEAVFAYVPPTSSGSGSGS